MNTYTNCSWTSQQPVITSAGVSLYMLIALYTTTLIDCRPSHHPTSLFYCCQVCSIDTVAPQLVPSSHLTLDMGSSLLRLVVSLAVRQLRI